MSPVWDDMYIGMQAMPIGASLRCENSADINHSMQDKSKKNYSVDIAELEKAETMTDPAMARLMLEGPKELKAITVNGQIIVETEDDRERCQNTHF